MLTVLAVSACSPAEPPPPPMRQLPVVEVIHRDQPIELEMVGQTRALPTSRSAHGSKASCSRCTSSRAAGSRRGELLYEIDPRPFESKVVEADGVLAEARTQLAKASADLDRIRPLAAMNAVSQQDLDGVQAQYDAALGSVQAAKARREQAEIELGYTRIHAPISGRIGISKARPGEFVGRDPNPVVLNFVSKTDPIRVRFSIDERRYLKIARRIRDDGLTGGEDRDAPIELILADGSRHPHRGRATAADAAIDPATGTFTVEADFPNPDGIVLAGQFARVRTVMEMRPDALLVPQRSVSELQGQFRVYVIGNSGEVELRPVTLGPKVDRLVVVESGLEPGDRVSLEVMRLREGETVAPVLTALDASGAPLPTNAGAPDTVERG